MSTSSLQSTRLLYFSDGARGLQHSTALNDLRLRAVVIAYEVAAPFGTQTLHWFACRDCPSLLYPTPFGISRLQHSTALNDLLLRAVVIAYEVAALFGTQTLHWFAFRGYFFAGGDAQLTPHTNKVLWGPRSPRQTHRYNYSTIQLLRRGTPRLYNYSQHFPSTPVAVR